VDAWVERTVPVLLQREQVVDVFMAHDHRPGRLISFQRLAAETRFAHLASELGLCLHAVQGPWLAFRAVVVLDVSAAAAAANDDDTGPVELLPFPCSPESRERARAQLERISTTPADEVEWTDWLALRDTVTVGKDHRYCQEMIDYHYRGLIPRAWPQPQV
jgi:hypothetical protein